MYFHLIPGTFSTITTGKIYTFDWDLPQTTENSDELKGECILSLLEFPNLIFHFVFIKWLQNICKIFSARSTRKWAINIKERSTLLYTFQKTTLIRPSTNIFPNNQWQPTLSASVVLVLIVTRIRTKLPWSIKSKIQIVFEN